MAREADPELSSLRALARKRHRAAGKKISRIQTASYDAPLLSGSRVDPRRDLGKVSRYNSAQLKAYIKQLDTFVSRQTQFVGDSFNRPIPNTLWKKYKDTENKMNQRAKDEYNKVKSKVLPTGETIEDFQNMTKPAVPQMVNPAVNTPFRGVNRRSRSVTSEKALRKLIKQMEQKYTPKDLRARARAGRSEVNKMLDQANRPDLQERIDKLSDKQFSVLWNYSGRFANSLSLVYELAKMHLNDKDAYEGGQFSLVSGAAYQEIEEFISWAEKM